MVVVEVAAAEMLAAYTAMNAARFRRYAHTAAGFLGGHSLDPFRQRNLVRAATGIPLLGLITVSAEKLYIRWIAVAHDKLQRPSSGISALSPLRRPVSVDVIEL